MVQSSNDNNDWVVEDGLQGSPARQSPPLRTGFRNQLACSLTDITPYTVQRLYSMECRRPLHWVRLAGGKVGALRSRPAAHLAGGKVLSHIRSSRVGMEPSSRPSSSACNK